MLARKEKEGKGEMGGKQEIEGVSVGNILVVLYIQFSEVWEYQKKGPYFLICFDQLNDYIVAT